MAGRPESCPQSEQKQAKVTLGLNISALSQPDTRQIPDIPSPWCKDLAITLPHTPLKILSTQSLQGTMLRKTEKVCSEAAMMVMIRDDKYV